MIKNEIAAYIKKVFTKAGYRTFNFGRKTRYDIGQKDFVDILCVGKFQVVFFEVKVGKDKLSPGQQDTRERLELLEGYTHQAIKYAVLTEGNYKEIALQILGGR
jgi:hypothetical protein